MCENDWPPINMPASQRCAPDGSKGIGRLGRFARVIPYRVRRQASIDPRGCRATCHGECGRLELIGICQIRLIVTTAPPGVADVVAAGELTEVLVHPATSTIVRTPTRELRHFMCRSSRHNAVVEAA